jgi:hypothetical protein
LEEGRRDEREWKSSIGVKKFGRPGSQNEKD